MRYKLPQISAPFDFLKRHLQKYDIPYKIDFYGSAVLKPMQDYLDRNIVNKNFLKLSDGYNMKPIIISSGKYIIDGHHAHKAQQLFDKKNVLCLDLCCDKREAIDILTKIQDRYDYEQNFYKKQKEKNDVLGGLNRDIQNSVLKDAKTQNSILNKKDKTMGIETTDSLGLEDMVSTELEKDIISVIGYRTSDINKTSETGNFFCLEKINDTYTKNYNIKTEKGKLLRVKKEDCTKPYYLYVIDKFFVYDEVVFYMQKYEGQNLSKEVMANKMICEKLKQMGYESILYEGKFVHVL